MTSLRRLFRRWARHCDDILWIGLVLTAARLDKRRQAHRDPS